MIDALKKTILAGLLAVTGCATVETGDIAETARPDALPMPTLTRFEEPLDCMDNAFADFGVSGVTIAVSAVPDYTGRIFVGSDIWLQSAITKMSRRSGAFVVTDYNPNQFAPEQGLWALSAKEGFYIPAYYVRGAISGFAGNIAENSATVGAGKALDGGAITTGSAYSLVSVDLNIGNLQQRTLISRAQTANEVVLESRASGAQLAGILEKFGANLEIVASRSEGVPHAVRALIELNAIESLGRLTGVPYWSCLGMPHEDVAASEIRRDLFLSMSNAERVVFFQRRLARLGHYQGPINGQNSAELSVAITKFASAENLSITTAGLSLYNVMTDWDDRGVVEQQVATAELPPLAPASQPVQAQVDSVSNPLSVNIAMVAPVRRAGAPVSVSLQSNQSAYAYCYMQDLTGGVARVFPNRWQPDPTLPKDQSVEIPGEQAGFDLVLPQDGTREELVCFVSSLELGAALPDALKTEDLTPMPITSLNALKSEFSGQAKSLNGSLVIKEVPLEAN